MQTLPDTGILFTSGNLQQGNFYISIGPVSTIQIQDGVFSDEERFWLELQLDTLESNQVHIGNKLNTIIDALDDLAPSQEDIQEAVEDAQSSHDDEQQQKYEDQAEENEQTAEDNSSAAQGTATSLLSVVGQFIGVLTSATPTNCNLNGNLIPHLPLGQLNLCQHDPPAAITAIGSLILIAFVVPLAYYTVKRMLALIGSFQN